MSLNMIWENSVLKINEKYENTKVTVHSVIYKRIHFSLVSCLIPFCLDCTKIKKRKRNEKNVSFFLIRKSKNKQIFGRLYWKRKKKENFILFIISQIILFSVLKKNWK